MTVIKLVSSQEQRPVRGCGTCRFYVRNSHTILSGCDATGDYAATARLEECNEGQMWEPYPPRPPGFWQRLGNLILDKLGG